MMIEKAYAHISGQTAVVVQGHDHAVLEQQAHPALLMFVILPSAILITALLSTIWGFLG